MINFFQWLESQQNIRVVSKNKNGEIVFLANDKKYIYIMDAGYFYNGFFSNWIKYQPGKALNFAKQHGELIYKTPEKDAIKTSSIQGKLFDY